MCVYIYKNENETNIDIGLQLMYRHLQYGPTYVDHCDLITLRLKVKKKGF